MKTDEELGHESKDNDAAQVMGRVEVRDGYGLEVGRYVRTFLSLKYIIMVMIRGTE